MLEFSEFVWALIHSVWDVFNNYLLIDATDWSKMSSDQNRFFIALSLYPLSFFANTPFKNYNFPFCIRGAVMGFHKIPLSLKDSNMKEDMEQYHIPFLLH